MKQINLETLVEKIRVNDLQDEPVAKSDLSEINNKFNIRLSSAVACGETVTTMSTCTRITTSTTPCSSTRRSESDQPESSILINKETLLDALQVMKN